jgi:hypothetical protein
VATIAAAVLVIILLLVILLVRPHGFFGTREYRRL